MQTSRAKHHALEFEMQLQERSQFLPLKKPKAHKKDNADLELTSIIADDNGQQTNQADPDDTRILGTKSPGKTCKRLHTCELVRSVRSAATKYHCIALPRTPPPPFLRDKDQTCRGGSGDTRRKPNGLGDLAEPNPSTPPPPPNSPSTPSSASHISSL